MKDPLIQDLTQIAKLWQDPHSRWRCEALRSAAPEFCLSPANFALALDWIFSQWTETQITTYLSQYRFHKHRYAVQVLSGTTPAMIAQAFFQGALLKRPQALKIPAQQPRFATLLHQTFALVSPTLAALFELHTDRSPGSSFYSRLRSADLVLLYGRDETIETLKGYLAPQALLIAHGHAESAAIIFKEEARIASLEKLAYDFLSYDQRGCLSPRAILVEEGGELSPARCAQSFAETILPDLARQLPRGGLFPGEAAEILHQRSLYGFRGPVYCGNDWTVCYDEQPNWPQQALPRFLPFLPFKHEDALARLLQPINKQLICLGYAGPWERLVALQLAPGIRLCSLGKMQQQLLVF